MTRKDALMTEIEHVHDICCLCVFLCMMTPCVLVLVNYLITLIHLHQLDVCGPLYMFAMYPSTDVFHSLSLYVCKTD